MIHKSVPIMPMIFLIVSNIAGNIVNTIVNTASPMINNGVINRINFTSGVNRFIKTEAIPKDFGKPIAASVAKSINYFCFLPLIREPRYELQNCLPSLQLLRSHLFQTCHHTHGQSFHSNEILSYSQIRR